MEPNRFIVKATTVAFVVVLFVTAGFVSGCADSDGGNGSEETTPSRGRVVRVQTSVATPQTFEERIQLTGTVEAVNDITISAEAGGRVAYVAVLGTTVRAGTVVAKFDDRVLKSRAAAAEAEYKLADDTFRRQEALFADSVISALEFDNARTRRDQARANRAQAQKMYEDTQLRSSIHGRVEAKYVDEGELVSPGTPVVRVVDTRHVKIKVGVPERYAADIAEGARVTVRLSAIGVEGEATLSFVGRVVNPQSRTFPVEIDIKNDSGLLKPEMVADVSIERRTIEDAIVIPQNALVHDDLGSGVFVVEEADGDLIAKRRNVEVGPSFGGQTVIESGLQSGDQVVVVGQSTLTDGNLVEVVGA
ncbi:MAG: efflux RND transporter periplasmic adaptor subunit [Rhodothermia bacterium]